MMLHGLRRFGASVAAITMLGVGVIATAGTANAAVSACPNNSVCVWSLPNFSGTPVFVEDASTMHDHPNTYYSSSKMVFGGLSTDNTSLGRFCTYNNNKQLTNVLNAQTSGNISNQSVSFVKAC
jgi:hypothetical protein